MNLFSIPFFQYDIDDWKDKKQKLLEICSTIDFKNYDTGGKNELGVNADNLYTDYNTNNDHIYRDQVVHILKKELQKFKNDCNLIKMSFKTDEIAEILSVSNRGVEQHRYRIKKKLKLSGDLSIFLQSL